MNTFRGIVLQRLINGFKTLSVYRFPFLFGPALTFINGEPGWLLGLLPAIPVE
jgi:hypothetical protein